uniref:Uncharacterized protein n=1 Tax=Anguilla anguilla TaxID=7936 RepID=A0A0E9V1Q5_ANGAN
MGYRAGYKIHLNHYHLQFTARYRIYK